MNKLAATPYPSFAELVNCISMAFDLRSSVKDSRKIERLLQDGDFSKSEITSIGNELIIHPLKKIVRDDYFLRNFKRFIDHIYNDYLVVVNKFPLEGVRREESLPLLVEYYFMPQAIAAFDCLWKKDGPSLHDFISPDHCHFTVVMNWMFDDDCTDFIRKIYPATTGDDKVNRDKFSRWMSGEQIPDLAGLKIFSDHVKRVGVFDKEKSKSLLKWLMLARALSWFEKLSSGVRIKEIMLAYCLGGFPRYDIGKKLSILQLETGKRLEALIEPFLSLESALSLKSNKEPGARENAHMDLISFDELLKQHDPAGTLRFRSDWLWARWHALSGEYKQAASCYKSAIVNSEYRAGDIRKSIFEEAMVLAAYLENKPLLKMLKNRAVISGFIPDPFAISVVVDDWEVERYKILFGHVFKGSANFVDCGERVCERSQRMYVSLDTIKSKKPNYRIPDQEITFVTDSDHKRKKPQLIHFVTYGEFDVVKNLLEKGASVDKLAPDGSSALMCALQRAIDRGDRRFLDLLLDYPHSETTLNSKTAKKKLTLLMLAIEYGEPKVVEKLVGMGVDPNQVFDLTDTTALYFSVKKSIGNDAVSTVLLNKMTGKAPLDGMEQESLRRYDAMSAGVLGNEKIDPKRIAPREGAILKAIVNFKVDNYPGDNVLAILELLLKKGANPNLPVTYPVRGRTPLMLAAQLDAVDIIRLLMRYGADPYQKDSDGHDSIVIAKGFQARNVIQHFQELKLI